MAASPFESTVCVPQALHPLHPEQLPRDFTMDRIAKNTTMSNAILINTVGIIMPPFGLFVFQIHYKF